MNPEHRPPGPHPHPHPHAQASERFPGLASGGAPGPVPRELRIGHAERDAATTELAEHYAVGRIDYEEHTRRLDQIWAARTASELRAAFVDLPGAYYQPAPVGSAGRSPVWSSSGGLRSHSWVPQRAPSVSTQRGETTGWGPDRYRGGGYRRVGPWFTRLPGAVQVVLVLLLVAMIAANLPVVMVVGAVWLLLRRGPRR